MMHILEILSKNIFFILENKVHLYKILKKL
jgi:hypothetical protein